MVDYWNFLLRQAPKWVLYAFESYILFIGATILFPAIFKNPFSIPIYFIWLILFIFSLNFGIQREKGNKFFYLLVTFFLFIGFWFFDISFISWFIVLALIVWRFIKIEEITEIDTKSYLDRIFLYIVISLIFYITNMFFDFPITNTWMVYSYVIMIGLFLLGSIILQLKDSKIEKGFRWNLFLQTFYMIIGIGVIIGLFFILKNYINSIILLIKKVLANIYLFFANILYNFMKKLIWEDGNAEDLLNRLAGENEDEEVTEEIVDLTYNENFWHYAELIIIVLTVLILGYFIIRLIKKTKYKPITINYTRIIEKIHLSKKNRKRFVSNNFYRKNYQKYLIWLNKVGKLGIEEHMASTEVRNKVVEKNHLIANEADQITIAYQEVRYGNINPEVTHQDFKGLIKKVKKELN